MLFFGGLGGGSGVCVGGCLSCGDTISSRIKSVTRANSVVNRWSFFPFLCANWEQSISKLLVHNVCIQQRSVVTSVMLITDMGHIPSTANYGGTLSWINVISVCITTCNSRMHMDVGVRANKVMQSRSVPASPHWLALWCQNVSVCQNLIHLQFINDIHSI